MIGACKTLKEFEYVHGDHGMFSFGIEIMPRNILEALLPHADTLEYLVLTPRSARRKIGHSPQPGLTWGLSCGKPQVGRRLWSLDGRR